MATDWTGNASKSTAIASLCFPLHSYNSRMHSLLSFVEFVFVHFDSIHACMYVCTYEQTTKNQKKTTLCVYYYRRRFRFTEFNCIVRFDCVWIKHNSLSFFLSHSNKTSSICIFKRLDFRICWCWLSFSSRRKNESFAIFTVIMDLAHFLQFESKF